MANAEYSEDRKLVPVKSESKLVTLVKEKIKKGSVNSCKDKGNEQVTIGGRLMSCPICKANMFRRTEQGEYICKGCQNKYVVK